MLDLKSTVLEQIVEIAYGASQQILQFYASSNYSVEQKMDESPLTAADTASHEFIESKLQLLFPNIPVLSEESVDISFEERSSWDEYWLVDPLDGTKEFIAGNPEFTVNIALIQNHKPVLGVVLVPPTGQCYAGASGLGAKMKVSSEAEWVAIESRTMSPVSIENDDFILNIVASRRHGGEALEAFLFNLRQKCPEIETKNIGSSLKMCLCADGGADLYPRLAPTSEWDTAAAHAVLIGAGGQIYDLDGKVLSYNTKESYLNPSFIAVGDANFQWFDYF